MKLAALFSGGKDSTYALYLVSKEHEIKYLVTMKSINKESYMFHTANIDITETQAKCMGISLIEKKTMGIKEYELKDIESVLANLKKKGILGIVSGAVASNYQKSRIEKICKKLGMKCISPLWGRDPEEVLREMVESGFEIAIVAVAAGGLNESWLGRRIDEKSIEELAKLSTEHGIHMMGEGGEFETLVTDCPLFRKKIIIEKSEKKWDKPTRSGELIVKKIRLAGK